VCVAAHSDHRGSGGDSHNPMTFSDSENEFDETDSDVEDVTSSQGGVLPAIPEVFFCVYTTLYALYLWLVVSRPSERSHNALNRWESNPTKPVMFSHMTEGRCRL
jgi:hypothetical protein